MSLLSCGLLLLQGFDTLKIGARVAFGTLAEILGDALRRRGWYRHCGKDAGVAPFRIVGITIGAWIAFGILAEIRAFVILRSRMMH